MQEHTFCQRCGMPLTKDPKGSGTNAHGTRRLMSCGYCYMEGHFVKPGMTLDDRKTLVTTTLHETGLPTFVARLVARNLHHLERWRPTASGPPGAAVGHAPARCLRRRAGFRRAG